LPKVPRLHIAENRKRALRNAFPGRCATKEDGWLPIRSQPFYGGTMNLIGRRRKFWFVFFFSGIFLLDSGRALYAEVSVTGTLSAVNVTTNNNEVAEVLAALENRFNVHYSTSVPLTVLVSGRYSGPLLRVVSRLLHGYNYVIKNNQDAVNIIVIGKRSEQPTVPELTQVGEEPPTKRWR
jgi:hypothetical protein